MTGPALTRAECQRLSGLVRLGLKAGLFGVQYEEFLAIADLVESYPLPPEDGEREGSARFLDERAASELSGVRALSAYYDDPEERQLIADANRAHREMAERYRSTAALLRQPPPSPAAGVSKGEVLGAIERTFRVTRCCSACGSMDDGHRDWCKVGMLALAVEALPEAAPREEIRR